MEEQGLDAFLVAVPENRYYLSGFESDDLLPTESSGYLLITPSDQYLLTDFRYQGEAEREAPDFSAVIYSEGLSQVLPDLFSTCGPRKVGVEGHYLPHKKYLEVEQALRGWSDTAELANVEDSVEQLRIIKDSYEIERIKASLALTEKALMEVWKDLRVGLKERDVAWEIERRIREGGGESVSFPPIVASGPNGALPHAVPTDRTISEGDSVILDLGSKLSRYCSDMTRTWIAGTAGNQLGEIYRIVREAQLAAQAVIRAGKDSVEIDGVARDFITHAGYGENFGHGLGHGVGLAVHEKPGLRKRNGMTLQENMVVTVEPGIYLPGFGGVRLENMVRVTETGCELLNDVELFYEF
jgi:Xaa-Pro aminopeptidase